MTNFRIEKDSIGEIEVPQDKLWGAQTQRSLKHFSIGEDLIPRELIYALVIIKKASAIVNYQEARLNEKEKKLIVEACDEILSGKQNEHFPLYVWMTGSGTQFNMNINEVIANRSNQIDGQPLASKTPIHPNDHVNMSQSTNDTFPSAMYMATAVAVKHKLIPSVKQLRNALARKAAEWKEVLKIGRTHMQDAVPMTLGQEFSGYVGLLDDNLERIEDALKGVYQLSLGGTAIGTGLNAVKGFDIAVAQEIAHLTDLPFVSASNKYAIQASHDALVQMSSTLKTLATSLYKMANDIILLSSGPRCGLGELKLPENEPGSSFMPGKVNPTQCEALAMVSIQVIANDLAVTMGGSGGHLQMNVFKPLIIHNLMKSIRLLSDGCEHFKKFMIDEMEPNHKKLQQNLQRSLMLVTALTPVVGYDVASKIAHHAIEQDMTLKEAATQLGHISAEEFDRLVDPKKMIGPAPSQ